MTRTVMQDTNASHCWAMLTGAWRLANGAEEVAWDEAAAAKRIKKGASWRPWLDKHLDPFRPVLVHNSRATDRAALNKQFGITED